MRTRRGTIILFVFIIIFLIAGTVILKANARLIEACTAETIGVIVDYDISRETDSDGTVSTYYYPIYKLEFNGKEVKSSTGSGTKTLAEGSKVVIHYNPDNYCEFYAEGDNVIKTIGYIFYGVAGLFFVILAFKVLGIGRYN